LFARTAGDVRDRAKAKVTFLKVRQRRSKKKEDQLIMATQSINSNASGFPLASVDHKVCRNTGVHHIGLHAKDPSASAEFYRDLLGMQIVGGSGPEHPLGASVFLSSRPEEESHEIVLLANPENAHVAFKVSSLAELRSLHTRIVEKGIPIKFVFNHGVSFSFYFDDPDGHMIEVYWPTAAPQSYRQPYLEPLDLTQPDNLLLEKAARGPAEP
jgi:catechol-2,3-dioxygenase